MVVDGAGVVDVDGVVGAGVVGVGVAVVVVVLVVVAVVVVVVVLEVFVVCRDAIVKVVVSAVDLLAMATYCCSLPDFVIARVLFLRAL